MRMIHAPRHAPLLLGLSLLLAVLVALSPALADEPAPEVPAPDSAAPADPVDRAIEQINKQDNGIQINREKLYLDVQGRVCLRSAEFLEMFACTADTREHEALVVLKAQPSMIHLGLLLLGQQPGKPLYYDQSVNPPKLVPATGPEVKIYIVTTVAGEEREIPANRWVKDNKTEKMMADNTWLFAGSVTTNVENERIYLADINGSAISLVNFGDDLLTLPNEMTQDNTSHGKTWAPRTEAIPKVGTQVRLRLRVQAPKPEATPQTTEAGPETTRDAHSPQDAGQEP